MVLASDDEIADANATMAAKMKARKSSSSRTRSQDVHTLTTSESCVSMDDESDAIPTSESNSSQHYRVYKIDFCIPDRVSDPNEIVNLRARRSSFASRRRRSSTNANGLIQIHQGEEVFLPRLQAMMCESHVYSMVVRNGTIIPELRNVTVVFISFTDDVGAGADGGSRGSGR